MLLKLKERSFGEVERLRHHCEKYGLLGYYERRSWSLAGEIDDDETPHYIIFDVERLGKKYSGCKEAFCLPMLMLTMKLQIIMRSRAGLCTRGTYATFFIFKAALDRPGALSFAFQSILSLNFDLLVSSKYRYETRKWRLCLIA